MRNFSLSCATIVVAFFVISNVNAQKKGGAADLAKALADPGSSWRWGFDYDNSRSFRDLNTTITKIAVGKEGDAKGQMKPSKDTVFFPGANQESFPFEGKVKGDRFLFSAFGQKIDAIFDQNRLFGISVGTRHFGGKMSGFFERKFLNGTSAVKILQSKKPDAKLAKFLSGKGKNFRIWRQVAKRAEKKKGDVYLTAVKYTLKIEHLRDVRYDLTFFDRNDQKKERLTGTLFGNFLIAERQLFIIYRSGKGYAIRGLLNMDVGGYPYTPLVWDRPIPNDT